MKILIVSQYFWPEQFRINDIAEYLSKKGYEVDVLTGIPNYPQGEINKDFKINKKKYSNFKGAEIYRVPIWLRRNSNKFNLFLNYISFVFSGIFFGYFILRKKNMIIFLHLQLVLLQFQSFHHFLQKLKMQNQFYGY